MFAIKITVQSINFRRELATIVRVLVIVTTVIRNVLLLIIHRIISISISFIRPYLNRISTSYASNTKLVVNATPELWQYQYQSWFSSKHHVGRGGIWNLTQTPQKNLKTRGKAEWVFKFVRGVWTPLSVVFSLYNTCTQISASIFQNSSQISLRNYSVWKIRVVWLKLKIWELTQNFENSLKVLVSSPHEHEAMEQTIKSPFSHILTFDQLRESSIFSFSFMMPQQMMECNKRSCAT